jgi:hypothetical protein
MRASYRPCKECCWPCAATTNQQSPTNLSGAFIDPATGKSTLGNDPTFDHPGVMLIQYTPGQEITHVSTD